MTTCVSFFRGINVGGNQAVKMNEIKELHKSLGLKDVATYIQSGNVVFTTGDEADLAQLPRQIEEGFAQKFGFHSRVFVRTSDELSGIIANNPFQNQPMKESKWVVVMLLAAHPDSLAQENLLTTYAGPEEFYVSGQELYLYYTNGIGRSKLTNALIEKKLKTSGTGRNLNTMLKLLEMTRR